MSSASFRTSTFDPILISAQIVALQSTYYLSASLIVFVLELLTGSPVTLNHVLMHDELRTDTVLGWSLFLANLMNAGLGSYYLLIIVQRAKLCLDFSCTLHILHIVITTLYSRSLPKSFFWWFCFLCTLVVLSLGGEYLCMQREMEPITLAGTKKRQSTSNGGDAVELQRLTDGSDDLA
ncbi:uncharacterized protein SPPG_06835 [Spizellomyces punctatus DAOM BR117]|uniref:Protein SYS1 n=1 Tax=Spizellomyces punctatus (strain DAOM BR117) TaxID=645134 RepID=A0A0L0HAU0_SPIPD|nr:uncharacterized protein SPPG_06835 [Spizellomyces punctatus DAOM BR117]KNC97838.1 hypothetical protein SPPG_06835 [Spizellomyces punctatus DAOM BR117]|eukprot:XP_016605878.1 hypothetical protein SPPG_06835 [Spizellomyces punctatus DAOM BR117]